MQKLYLDINRALKAVRARKLRGKDYFYTFIDRYGALVGFLDYVSKKTKNPYYLDEARDHYLVTIVSATEVYFKDLLFKLIEKNSIKESLFEEEGISISDLEKLDFNKLSLNELKYQSIVNKYNFMNMRDIDSVFSKGLGIHFFAELKDFAFDIDKRGHPFKVNKRKSNFYLDKDFYKQIQDIFQKRHQLIHDFDTKFYLKKSDVDKTTDQLFMFVFVVDNFVDLNYLKYTPKHRFRGRIF